MAKIGTAHIEIKPVLNEAAMAEIEARLGIVLGGLNGLELLAVVLGDLRERIESLESSTNEGEPR